MYDILNISVLYVWIKNLRCGKFVQFPVSLRNNTTNITSLWISWKEKLFSFWILDLMRVHTQLLETLHLHNPQLLPFNEISDKLNHHSLWITILSLSIFAKIHENSKIRVMNISYKREIVSKTLPKYYLQSWKTINSLSTHRFRKMPLYIISSLHQSIRLLYGIMHLLQFPLHITWLSLTHIFSCRHIKEVMLLYTMLYKRC